jgi:hypothetical protein
MKMHILFNYAQVHADICCVFKGLQSPYGEAHEPYDQTHGSYGQAHATQPLAFTRKYLNRKSLPAPSGLRPRFYMEWFMVWINLTKGNAGKHIAGSSGWFGVCLPIKTAALHGLHRKSLEQNARLMLQKQKMHFVF